MRPHIAPARPARLAAAALLLLAFGLAPTPFVAAQTTSVVDLDSSTWGFVAEGGGSSPTGYFAAGPGTAPFGSGSLLLGTDEASDGVFFATQEVIDLRLDAITALSYWTYASLASEAPTLQLNVDYNGTDMNVSWQGRLVFEPSNGNGNSTPLVWEEWDTLTGMWWSTGAPGSSVCPQNDPCTWAEVLTAFPDAQIWDASLGAMGLKAGSGWSAGARRVFADGLRVTTTTGIDTLYDFEPLSYEVTELGTDRWFSDDTRADGTAPMPEAVGTNLVSPTLTDDPEGSSMAATADHDDDIRAQIDFPILGGPDAAPPAGEWQGSVHVTVANQSSGKSQISLRNDPSVTGDADGFGLGWQLLGELFTMDYSWLAEDLGNAGITGAVKLGFQTSEYGSAGASSRTGENAWDKLLVYEPSNGNGGVADSAWHSEEVTFSQGAWWIVDRVGGISTTGSNPMTLEDMTTETTVMVGGRTVQALWELLTSTSTPAVLTSIQFGIGSGTPNGSAYLNQLSLMEGGISTRFGFDRNETTFICVPNLHDGVCDLEEPTIQSALDLVGLQAEDIVLVDSGVYAENLTAERGVTLLGAAEGVPGCGRVGEESVIAGSLLVGAPGVTVDGFRFAGPASPQLLVTAAGDDARVRNNRFADAEYLVQIGSVADPAVDVSFEDNELTGPPPVDRGVLQSGLLQIAGDTEGLYIMRNCFSDSAEPAIQLELAAVERSAARLATFGENVFQGTAGGIDVSRGTTTDLRISGNEFTGLSGLAVTGHFDGASIIDNQVAMGSGGIRLAASSVEAAVSADSQVLLNCFAGNTGPALEFADEVGIGSNYASFNDIVGNTVGATYAGGESVDVESNYWGAADGPAGAGPGSGDTVVGAGLDFSPFSAAPWTIGTPCSPLVDLAVTKTNDAGAVADVGDPVVYTIVVENLGPSPAGQAQVTDFLPQGLSGCTWTCQATGLAQCGAASGSGDLEETIDVPSGDSVTYEVACTFAATGGTVANTATVVAQQPESSFTNNLSTSVVRGRAIFSDDFESGDLSAWSNP